MCVRPSPRSRSSRPRGHPLERCVDLATLGGRSVVDRHRGLGLEPGGPADLVLLPGESVTSAVMDRPEDRTVLRAGHVVADNGELPQR